MSNDITICPGQQCTHLTFTKLIEAFGSTFPESQKSCLRLHSELCRKDPSFCDGRGASISLVLEPFENSIKCCYGEDYAKSMSNLASC